MFILLINWSIRTFFLAIIFHFLNLIIIFHFDDFSGAASNVLVAELSLERSFFTTQMSKWMELRRLKKRFRNIKSEILKRLKNSEFSQRHAMSRNLDVSISLPWDYFQSLFEMRYTGRFKLFIWTLESLSALFR